MDSGPTRPRPTSSSRPGQPSSGQQPGGQVVQVGDDQVGGVGKGVEDLAGAGDEGGLAAGGAGAGDVPGVGGDEQDVGGVDPEAGGGHVVGLGGRLEAVDGVGRQ